MSRIGRKPVSVPDAVTVEIAPGAIATSRVAATATADSLAKNVPATVTRLTGGEYFKLGSERNIEQNLTAIGNHLPNRYILSFYPQSPHPGIHMLTVNLPDYKGLQVTARTSYSAGPIAVR